VIYLNFTNIKKLIHKQMLRIWSHTNFTILWCIACLLREIWR